MKRVVSGVPLGGIGAGKIELCRDGRFRNFTGFNNSERPIANGYDGEAVGRAFFASYVEGEGAVALADTAAEVPALGEGSVRAKERFPFVELEFGRRGDVELSLRGFSPTKLHDDGQDNYKDSSLPGARFVLTAKNHSNKEKYVAFAFTLDNLIGEGGHPGVYFKDHRTNYAESHVLGDGIAVVHAHKKPKADQRLNGNTSIAVFPSEGADGSVRLWGDAAFELGRSHDVWEEFDAKGSFEVREIDPDGFTGVTAGTLASGKKLAPGQSLTVEFVLSWYFPDRYVSEDNGLVQKNMYARWFGHSLQVARYLHESAAQLEADTQAWHDHINGSNLPPWMKQRLIDSLFVLNSNSLYLVDGRFGVSEAPTQMAGCMGTIDQRASSSSIYSMCFPQLGKSELRLFMDQQIDEHHAARHGKHWNTKKGVFGLKLDRLGAVRHDTGWDHLDGGKLGGKTWTTLHWPDLTSVYTLQIYEQCVWSGDEEFLKQAYPKVVQALEFQARLDQDGDGIADLWGPGCSTYDNENFPFYGASSFVGTLYLAALRAAEKMAIWQGDHVQAGRFRETFSIAQRTIEESLFDEELGYYKHWVDVRHEDWSGSERPHGRENTDCFVSQIAGEWFAARFGFGPLLSPERVASSLAEIGKRNVDAVTGCPANESSKEGKTSHSWPYYIETYYAANSILHGLPELGFEALKKIYRAFYETDGNPYSATLTWESENNATAHWGRWYMTNPSIWFLPQAISGFDYVARESEISLNPNIPKQMERLSKCPLFMPDFWGTVDADKETITFSVTRLVHDRFVSVKKIRTPRAIKTITLGGRELPFTQENEVVTLKDAVALGAHHRLELAIR